jgi:hypothetical protein
MFAMEKFLIEVSHEAEKMACARAVRILLTPGSHYLTNADFGCSDGVHKAWIIAEVESKDQARGILPPAYRSQARIVKLNKFSIKDLDELLGQHKP